MSNERPQCKNTKGGRHTNWSGDRYGGYCFDCHCFGVPEMEAEIEKLRSQLVNAFCVRAEDDRQRGRRALEWLDDNYNWLVGQLTADYQADLDAILDGWRP